MADQDAIYAAIRKADAAGDADSVRKLAAYLKTTQSQPTAQPRQAPAVQAPAQPQGASLLGKLAIGAKGFIQGLGDVADMVSPGKYLSDRIIQAAGGPDLSTATRVASAAHSLGVPNSVSSADHFVEAGARGAGSALPLGGGGLASLLPGVTSGTASELARQAGYGKLAQIAAGILGGGVGAGTTTATRATARIANSADQSAARAGRIIVDTLKAQGQTPAEAGAILDQASSRGVPLALMDTGDEMRGLASALGRKPGESRTLIRDAVIPRQEAQLDRVQGAITRDLGPTANVRAASEDMMKGAQQKAAPLYEKAYAAPPVQSPELDSILNTPAAKQALSRAVTIAANERRDPRSLGFVVGKDGQVVLDSSIQAGEDAAGNLTATLTPKRVQTYSPQTLDYIKRGLDDVVESHRDPMTGRLKLDEGLHAINKVRADFLKEVDRLNPDYAAARKAYAGPASMNTALQKGAKIGTKDADTVWAETRDLTPAELEQYKLGVRSALSKALEGRTDAADKVKALVGTPKKRAALARLFGGTSKFDNFMATLADEQRAAATHARVNTGSPTAPNLADDAHLEGLSGVAANVGVRAIKGHGMVSNAIATVGDLYRYGGGKAGQRLRSQLAAGISETDPVAIRKALHAAAANLERRRRGTTVPKVVALGALSGTKPQQ